MAKTTVVQADLIARDKASPVFDKFGRRVQATTKDTNLLSRATVGLVKAFGSYVAIRSATNFLRDANAEARESQKVSKITAAHIKSTGGVAKVTTGHVEKLSTAISIKSGIDDEAVQSGSNLLLTFKNVRNEVGKGAQIFDRATQAAVDLAASGFGDINTTSKQLGKALNDPVRGMTALGRAGVTFTDSAKEHIKSLVEQNRLLDAQKFILKEVESQVGGTAAAQTTAGDRARESYKQAQEVIGTALLPAVDAFSNVIAKHAVPAAEKFSGWLKSDGIPLGREFGTELKSIGSDALPVIATGAEVAVDVLGALAPVVSAVTTAFGKLPSSAQNMLLLAGAAGIVSSKFSTAGAGLLNYVTNMEKANAKSLALRTGALAGGVALGSLSGKAHDSSRGLGVLTDAAAGAALGFAVGGPWGAAIGGAGGALVGFMRKSDKTAGAVDRNKAANNRYADSFDQVTNKATRATRALVATDLQKGGVFKMGAQLGIQADLLVDAAMGLNGAREKLAAQIGQMTGADAFTGHQLLAALGLVQDEFLSSKEAAKQFNDAVNGTSPTIDVNDKAGPKLNATKQQMQQFEGWLAMMGLDADTMPAKVKAEMLKAWLQSQNPKMPIDGNDKKGRGKGKDFKRWIDSITGTVKIDANTVPATKAVNRFIASQRGKSVHIPIIGDFKLFGAEGGPIQGFAPGGPVRGAGGPKADRVPAMLSNGEHVFDAKDVQLMGGQGGVLAFRRALNNGSLGRFADGGPAAATTTATLNGPIELSPRTIRALGKEFAAAMQGTRPRNGEFRQTIAGGR